MKTRPSQVTSLVAVFEVVYKEKMFDKYCYLLMI